MSVHLECVDNGHQVSVSLDENCLATTVVEVVSIMEWRSLEGELRLRDVFWEGHGGIRLKKGGLDKCIVHGAGD